VYKKHYPPKLKDEVWRLEKIGKDGSFHKRLNKSGISTVEDFLRLVVRDRQKLRSVSSYFMRILHFVHLSQSSKLFCDDRYSEVVCLTRCGKPLWNMQRLVC
jgi:hypothetical protein